MLETSRCLGLDSAASVPSALKVALPTHSTPLASSPLPSPCDWLQGCALDSSPGALCVQTLTFPGSAPVVTGRPAAPLTDERQELFPEVVLGQQASAPWQRLPGSAVLALAASLAKAGARESHDGDLQCVTEKGRVTGGSRSGNPVPVLQNKWAMETSSGSSAQAWLSPSDRVRFTGVDRRLLGPWKGEFFIGQSQPGRALKFRKIFPGLR